MSNSIGLIESKGIVALIEAADVILKNSPVTILGIHKLENGLVSLAVIGDSDYVKAAIESGSEAGRRVGEIYASSVVDNPGKELLELFSELFPGDEISNFIPNQIPRKYINSVEKDADPSSSFFSSVSKQAKPESKREKSKPLQVTKITPVHKIKKNNGRADNQSTSKPNKSLEKKIEDNNLEVNENDKISSLEKPLSTIERLRIEALGLENNQKKSNKIIVQAEKKSEETFNSTPTIKIKDVDFNAISQMNVHKLRHYAREFADFPIKGREISRANRNELVELFKNLKNS